MNSSPLRGDEGSGLDVDCLQSSLPGLQDFKIDEHIAGVYARYTAIHEVSSLPVWVHHFVEVDPAMLAKLDEPLGRMQGLPLEGFLRPLGHVKHEGGLLLVTDSTEGIAMDKLLRNVDPNQARRWASELSSVLGQLHAEGVIHGRLCPQSIFITAEGPKVLGAGFSGLWESVWTAMESAADLPPRCFTSLEVRLSGIEEAEPAADVFSLGTILYRGYTNSFPGEFCPLPSDRADVPRCVDGAVMVALHPEAARRQQSMDEFIDEFTGVCVRSSGEWMPRALADDAETGPSKQTWLDGSGRWLLTAPWWTLAAVVLIALAWVSVVKLAEERDRDVAETEPPAIAVEKEKPAAAEPELVEGRSDRLLELLRYADLAASLQDWFLEHEALQIAYGLAPGDLEIEARLRANPWYVRGQIRDAIVLLKLSNPAQTEWRILADFEPGGCRLDLSGNPYLQHIAGLRGQRLLSLDLSGTKVSDLSPLEEAPPRELRIKGTPVSKMSMFDPKVTSITGDSIPLPVAGHFWENPDGIRFAPSEDFLMSRCEVTRAEFELFAAAADDSTMGSGMQSLEDGEWQILGHDWRDPGFEIAPDQPVVGVSRAAAESFCDWLTRRDRASGAIGQQQFYRLPSDYEWGIAAGIEEHQMLKPSGRRDLAVRRASTNQLRIAEGYGSTSGPAEQSQAVVLARVATGLPDGQFFDLLGNVKEWCASVDDQGLDIARGMDGKRISVAAGSGRQDIGFRVVLDLGVAPEPGLGRMIAARSWKRGREIALANAFDPNNYYARQTGRAFLEARGKIVSDELRDKLDPAFTTSGGSAQFQLVRLPMPWHQAKQFAADAGGRLAGADDIRVLEQLAAIDADEPTTLWLGARREASGWLWESGDGEKRIRLPQTESEDARLLLTGSHGLRAVAANRPHAFVIQWELPQGDKVARTGGTE